MALDLLHAEKGIRPMGETVVITEHLYLTEDKTRVVKEGDPASRWLWASPGQEVQRAEALRLGAIARDAPAPEPVPEPVSEPEAEAVAETAGEPEAEPDPKQRKAATDKRRGTAKDK